MYLPILRYARWYTRASGADAPASSTATVPAHCSHKRALSHDQSSDRSDLVDCRRAGTVDFSSSLATTLCLKESVSLASSHPSRPSKASRRSASPRSSHSTTAVVLHQSAIQRGRVVPPSSFTTTGRLSRGSSELRRQLDYCR